MGFFDRSANAIRTGLRERVFEPRALRDAQRRSPSVSASVDWASPVEPMATGRAELGEAMLAGTFTFDGWTAHTPPQQLWRARSPSPVWSAAAQGFEWLADLEALGGPRADEAARSMVAAWLDRHRSYDTMAWRTDVAAARLWTLLGSELFQRTATIAGGDDRLADRLRRSLSAHVLWLERRWPETPEGMPALRSAASLLWAVLSLEGLEDRRPGAEARLIQTVEAGLDADGLPTSRNPEDALEVFEKLQTLREAALGRDAVDDGESAPELLSAMGRVAAALRYLRRPDGGAPLFHGARRGVEGRLEAALTRARLPNPAPEALTAGGYLKFSGGRVSVLMDVGGRGVSGAGHLSPLAIELSSGRRRMVVNCGSAAHLGGAWAAAARSLAGHSTLSMDGPAAELAEIEPELARADRRSERNGDWLFGSHDGFAPGFGVRVARRMFLTADGGDFRGEDVVEPHPDGGRTLERRLSKLPRSERADGLPFTIQFHLHPEIEAELVADGEAVALRLPHGENWVMRQAGGRIALAESFYLDRPGAPRACRRIVVRARFPGERTPIRWAFRRVGELAQQPKDVEALLAAARGEDAPSAALDAGGSGRGRAEQLLERLGRPPFSG